MAWLFYLLTFSTSLLSGHIVMLTRLLLGMFNLLIPSWADLFVPAFPYVNLVSRFVIPRLACFGDMYICFYFFFFILSCIYRVGFLTYLELHPYLPLSVVQIFDLDPLDWFFLEKGIR